MSTSEQVAAQGRLGDFLFFVSALLPCFLACDRGVQPEANRLRRVPESDIDRINARPARQGSRLVLTRMTDDDWAIVLEVFDGVQSRRGEPGHDERKFLEALHYFTVHSVTWRALPAEFGNWNSIWKRLSAVGSRQ